MVNIFEIDCVFYLDIPEYFKATQGKFLISKYSEGDLKSAYFIKIASKEDMKPSLLVRETNQLKLNIRDDLTYLYERDGKHIDKYNLIHINLTSILILL